MTGDCRATIEIESVEGCSPSELVEMMTGYSPYALWRCESEDNGVQCREMAVLDLGNPPKVQLCAACARKPAYKRFRVREPMHHSERLKREYRECRRRHLSLVAAADRPAALGRNEGEAS